MNILNVMLSQTSSQKMKMKGVLKNNKGIPTELCIVQPGYLILEV